MKVAALTQGRNAPSSRFRIRQNLPALAELGIDVTEYCPVVPTYVQLPGRLGTVRRRYLLPMVIAQVLCNLVTRVPGTFASRRSDLVWISRSYQPGLDSLVRLTGGPRVLDVDDAVWLTDPLGPKGTAATARRMDLVVVGNAYLADWYRGHNTEIEIIPTGVDCDIHRPRSAPTVRDAFTLGWIGTSSNFGYVRMIFGELERFLDDCRDASFLMVADRRPDWWPDSNPQMRFCRWRADEEVRRIEEMDVGLMPLEESEWTRGKCSFKMLQYMASGKPVVVSPVGMNRDVLELGDCGLAPRHTSDWYAAFEALHADQSLRERLSRGGRAIVLDHFSTEIVAHRYAEVFSRIVS